ncbi:peptidase inhibitor 16-like [Corvus hawaiiensis]|uniref:peptidase inhibitor 16-like n=1 Tax=Corvus hawaiiensis TaxID=134902 RepID=UPI002019A39C|nr:peptidase inhibitor 16-like [Corvus hawaiiensis]XP_048183363.1 peptidase inhibitor 16-like [Corvus hawaiiensis]
MLSSGLCPVLLVLSVLQLSWSLSDEEKKIILDEHNKYRSEVDPPARAMMKMTWDPDLEVNTRAFAKQCIWGKNGEQKGKNFFATASTLDVKLAIEQWDGEREFYSFTTHECDNGQTCDNHTQMVWADTTRTGCGKSFCEKVDGIETENVHVLVCSYFPPGNMKSKKPYMEGPPCTMCPTGTVCVNNLCVSALDTENQQMTSVDPPKAGAPSTCLGLSLFLVPSAILVGLLL